MKRRFPPNLIDRCSAKKLAEPDEAGVFVFETGAVPEAEKRKPMMEFLNQLWSFNLDRETVFGLFEQSFVFMIGMTAILASLGVILCATPIYSALYLIANMMCLALLFLLYNAEFLAAVQVIVYAGAVMILFLFIIALLGAKKEERVLSFQNLASLGFVGLLFCELLMSMMVGETKPVEGQVTPEMVQQVGSAKAIGIELFSHHIIPFELASLLLLVAAVGIISLAKFPFKPLRKRTRV